MKTIDLNKLPSLSPEERRLREAERKISQLKGINTELKRTVRFWQQQSQEAENKFQVALALQQKIKPIIIKPSKGEKESETTPILVLCDWHAAEKIDPETVNSLNEVTLEITDKRIKKTFTRGLKLTNIWRKATKIDTLVIAILGDLFSGYIHEEFLENNELSPIESILWVQERLIGGINFLLKEGDFKQIIIPCSIGNHGRTTKKPRISTAYRNSYEWLMYNEVALRYKNNPKVHFQIAKGYHNYLQIYDYLIRFHHGDYIKYKGGQGGLTIPANKQIARWNKSRRAYLDIFGHFHTRVENKNLVACGPLIGYNPYAIYVTQAVYAPPEQTLIFIEKDLGKTATLPIFL